MASRIRDRNIWLIYFAVLLLGTAYGVSIALIALHLDARGFDAPHIGMLASCFASGIVALALPADRLIRAMGAKTALVLSIAGYAVSVAVFPLLTSFPVICAARFLDGAFSVCTWVCCETILLHRASRDNKANVTSLYATSIAIGYIAGPLLARVLVVFAPMYIGFIVSGIIAAVSCVLVLARLDRDAHDAEVFHEGASSAQAERSALELLARIKTSCFATFAYGYFQASVVLFLPIFLINSKGIERESTILVPAYFAAGMLLFSNVAGRIGDRVGHLLVMRVLAAIGTTMVLGFVFLTHYAWMCVAVFVAGATLASISPVSLALQGVVTEPRDYSRANSIYNAFYASGILLGPLITAVIFGRWGGAAMLYHLAALWAAFVLFASVFYGDDPVARRERVPARVGAEPLAPSDG